MSYPARPDIVKADPWFLLQQLKDLEEGRELTSDIWSHPDFQILKDNSLLRDRFKAALEAIIQHKALVSRRDELTWGWRVLHPTKYEEIGNEIVRLLRLKDEAVRQYEIIRRLAAFDNKSLALEL